MDDYIDLTNPETNLENYSIEADGFNCKLCDIDDRRYKGFLLAKSDKGNAYTICNVDFQWSHTDSKYPARIILRRTNANLQDKAVRKDQEFATVSFDNGQDGYREFWQMIAFLSKYQETLDLKEFFQKYQVVTREGVVDKLREYKPSARMEEITQYVVDSGLSEHEMAEWLAIKARQNDVEIFEKLLKNTNDFRSTYKDGYSEEIKGAGQEAIWHHFLKTRQWIFGLSIDLRFIEDFLDEQSVGEADTSRQGDPKVDMLGYSDYTVLIELKTPDTDIFTEVKTSDARTNTWSFTSEFIEGFSQCLAQKTDWEKNSPHKEMNDGGRLLDRGVIRTIDPQAIYVVGNKDKELPRDSDQKAVRLKRDTLERFIRNNRNVNIVSFDELYRRAYHIAYGEHLSEVASAAETPLADEEEIDLDDIPF